MEFVKKHKGLVITVSVIVVIFIIMLCIRSHNLKKKAQLQAEADAQTQVTDTSTEESSDSEEDKETYSHKLGLNSDKGDSRVVVDEELFKEEEKEPEQTEPTYEVGVKVFDNNAPRNILDDGSSTFIYRDKVSATSIESKWGTPLTHEDFVGGKQVFVGVTEHSEPIEKESLQSTGWLMNNLGNLAPNDCVQFTSLHVMKSLSADHTFLLCIHDWYSAFGLTDTVVVFEDISGTLNPADFKEGDVFSATAFVHNIKLAEVCGKRALLIQYSTYEK